MSRYIDADALKNKITELDGGSAIDGTGFDIYTCEVFELIDEIPVADVVEAVHGEWIKQTDEQCYWYECSVCGDYPLKDSYGHDVFSDFCPNCGANMRMGG